VFASNEVVCASWKYTADENVPNIRHINEVIGVFVTAGARIHLYKYLDRLKQKTLYCGTDSVIFIQTDDQPALFETGDCLGAMTSDLKPGLHIEEFVSGGPKIMHTEPSNPRQASATLYVRFAG
jgi:hypothetical protein